jgi:hypothetical protein
MAETYPVSGRSISLGRFLAILVAVVVQLLL